MKTDLTYYRVFYTYPGGKAHTVTTGTSSENAWRTFQRENSHVTVTKVESDSTGETITKVS